MHVNPELYKKAKFVVLSKGARHLLHVLYATADPESGCTRKYASVRKLSDVTGYTRNTVEKHLKELQSNQIIVNIGKASNKVVNYRLYKDEDLKHLANALDTNRRNSYKKVGGFSMAHSIDSGGSLNDTYSGSLNDTPSGSLNDIQTDLTDLTDQNRAVNLDDDFWTTSWTLMKSPTNHIRGEEVLKRSDDK